MNYLFYDLIELINDDLFKYIVLSKGKSKLIFSFNF